RGGLDERRGGDPARDRVRLAGGRGARYFDLEQDGRAFAVRDDLLRQVGADLAERGGELDIGRRCPLDPALAVGEQDDGVVRRAFAVDRDPVEALVDRALEEAVHLVCRQRVVGGDNREHRRQVRV